MNIMTHILAWGKANSGALGLGGTDHHAQTTPLQIHSTNLENTEIRHISTGETHTLLCVKNGSVYSCGSNHFRQCGREENLSKFERVKGLQSEHVIQVATGTSHSVILTQSHEVLTWGKNTEGQLGRGDASEEARGTPILVKSLAVTRVIQVACGSDHTLVLTNEGRVGVWGSNSYGQLGLGSSASSNLNRPTWVASISGLPVAQVVAGGYHSFVLSKSGAIYGWGRNSFGQLGMNDTEDSSFPKQCRPLRSQRIKYICCGENHTACLTVDGRVFTFGAGTHGQLGHGSCNNEILPRQVMELTESEVSQIACGRGHTLVYAPKAGRLYSFGLGKSGQLGLSTTDNKDIPTTASGLFNTGTTRGSPNQGIRTIYAGGDHCFAIAQDVVSCVSDDFRVQDLTRQMLTLTNGKFEVLRALKKDDIPSDELVEEMTKIFSFASCLNGSFLLPNDDHYETTSKKHGVDMKALRAFFTELNKMSNIAIMKMISTSIEKNLIPSLPQSPPDVEALRVYLMLPECFIFDQPELYSSIILSFARSFISFKSIILAVFDTWWSSMQPTFFKRLVVVYKSCLGYLFKLPLTNDPLEVIKKLDSVSISLNMLQTLNQVNEAHNQIIPFQEFYVPDLKDSIRDAYISWAQQTNYLGQVGDAASQGLYLCNYPFLFDGAAKSVLLETDAALQMQNAIEVSQFNELMGSTSPLPLRTFDPTKLFLILTVQRGNLVQDTLAQLQTKSSADFKKPLKIIFQGEEAFDAGGVRKEFFRLLFKDVMDPTFGMFKISESSKLLWFNPSTLKEPNMFKMIGLLCGLAVYNSTVIHLDFPEALFKKLLKRPVTLDDFKELDPVSGKGLQEILSYKDDKSFEDAYLFFETQGHPSVELCPGGGNKPVDQTNKHEYIDLTVDFYLNKSIEVQFNAFNEGFHSVCGGRILELFNSCELQALVVGSEDYDFKEFQKNTEYKEDYSSKHPVIMMFWEVFHEIGLEDKKQFLLFLTARDRIPVSGMKELKMTIQPFGLEGEERLMPMAYTCYNLLCLPRYAFKATLKERFLLAIKQTDSFGLG